MAVIHFSYEQFLRLASERHSEWLWEGVFPAGGIAILAAAAYGNKSTLMATLVAAMSGPGDLAGRPVRTGACIYAALEHHNQTWAALFREAAAGAEVARLDVEIVRSASLDSDADVSELRQLAEARDARLVVIDPLRRSSQLEENRSEDIAAIAKQAFALTDNGNRLVVILHHLGHNGRVRGSTDLSAMSDSIVKLTTKGACVTLHARHHHAPEVRAKMHIVREKGRLTLHGDHTPIVPARPHRDAIVAYVAGYPGSSTTKIRTAISGSNASIDEALRQLLANGELRREGCGKRGTPHQWFLAQPPATPATHTALKQIVAPLPGHRLASLPAPSPPQPREVAVGTAGTTPKNGTER